MDRAAFRDPGTGVPESPCMRSATSYKMQVQFPTFLVCNFLHFYYATFKAGEFSDMSKLSDELIEVFFGTELLPLSKVIVVLGDFTDETQREEIAVFAGFGTGLGG